MGMTPTLTREMARYTAGVHTSQSIRDLLRSLEFICVVIAVLIGLSIWAAANWLASDWLKAGTLPIRTVTQAIGMMGVVAAFRFVEGLYRGAIIGLQKQVWFNGVQAILSTIRAGGAVAILVWVSPTIQAYFLWQGTCLPLMSLSWQPPLTVACQDRKIQHDFPSRHYAKCGTSRAA